MQNDYSSYRKHERATLDLYINKIVGDEPHLVRVRDISAGGLYLYKLLEPSMNSDQPVGLEMKLPNSEEIIWAVGQVVRNEDAANTDGLAIRFVRISESDKKLIEEYVRGNRAA